MSEETRMRRLPKQARSQQRVDHLLDVAAQTFEEVGYTATTTNAIAARAGVSIGSLYQFFPNKEAIMDALVERYLAELLQVVFVTHENLSITALIDQAIDDLTRFHESHAGFRTLLLDNNLEYRIHGALVQVAETMLSQRFPTLSVELCRQTAITWLGITKGMMKLTEPPDNFPEGKSRSETKLAMIGYLRAVLLRAGVPLPDDLRQV